MDKFEEPEHVSANKLNLKDTFSINLNVWTRPFLLNSTCSYHGQQQRCKDIIP